MALKTAVCPMQCSTKALHTTMQCSSSLQFCEHSSENGVFCARGVNGMHAMGLQLHFCQGKAGLNLPMQCNAMPFSDTLQLAMHYTAVQVQVITWAGAVGSPKLPRPVREQTFLHSFQNSQQLQHLLAPPFLHPSSLHCIESPFARFLTSSR